MSIHTNTLWMYMVKHGQTVAGRITYGVMAKVCRFVDRAVTARTPIAMTWGTDKPNWISILIRTEGRHLVGRTGER